MLSVGLFLPRWSIAKKSDAAARVTGLVDQYRLRFRSCVKLIRKRIAETQQGAAGVLFDQTHLRRRELRNPAADRTVAYETAFDRYPDRFPFFLFPHLLYRIVCHS